MLLRRMNLLRSTNLRFKPSYSEEQRDRSGALLVEETHRVAWSRATPAPRPGSAVNTHPHGSSGPRRVSNAPCVGLPSPGDPLTVSQAIGASRVRGVIRFARLWFVRDIAP